jgi:cytochrome P450
MQCDINDRSISIEERDAAYQWLRDNDPVHCDEKNGFWILTRREDVRALAKDAERFPNAVESAMDSAVEVATANATDHATLRPLDFY